jgi:hypothetical protein
MKRPKSLVQRVLEADEATQRDIRNGARVCGWYRRIEYEPTDHPRPSDPVGSFDEED